MLHVMMHSIQSGKSTHSCLNIYNTYIRNGERQQMQTSCFSILYVSYLFSNAWFRTGGGFHKTKSSHFTRTRVLYNSEEREKERESYRARELKQPQ